ncbi:MAG: hypothetical protein LBI66_01545 [Burkholderiaceae bacterium]|jgi:hypothetical protein|nr:hypothetical protein [Burkholderiaceae bacterium]
MKLTADMRLRTGAPDDYPELQLDGRSLAIVIAELTKNAEITQLVPAHSWLWDKEELALAWDRLLACHVGQVSHVPLLICPDDMDLHCTVLVAEQSCLDSEFVWSRFGFAMDWAMTHIEWLPAIAPLSFRRADFVDEVFKYAELCEWSIEI